MNTRLRLTSNTFRAVLALSALGLSSYALAAETSLPRPASIDSPPDLVRQWSIGLWKPVGGPTAKDFAGQSDEEYNDPKSGPGTNPPPYNAKYEAIYKRVREAAWAGTDELDYGGRCLLYGMPSVMEGSVMEFVFEPGRVYIIFEEQGGVGRIWLDGRQRPRDMERTYNGFSAGHWEGRTLVVETTYMRTDSILDLGAPHSDALKVIERISPEGSDGMKNEVTIIDAKALTRPWNNTWHYLHHQDWVMQERVCAENNRTENNSEGKPGTIKGVNK
jgi:hypothetical protein